MSSPNRQQKILYVGTNHALFHLLHDALAQIDCLIVRSSNGFVSHVLLESNINYSLLLFDDKLLDMTGQKLKRFTRKLLHRKHTPIIIYKKSDELNPLVETILKLLAPHDQAGRCKSPGSEKS